MPIYEYICSDCKHQFETLVRNSKETPACPECKSTRLKRKLSTFSASVPASHGGCAHQSVCPSASPSCGCGCGCGHKHG